MPFQWVVICQAWKPATPHILLCPTLPSRASQGRSWQSWRPDIAELDTRLVEANDIIDGYFSATFKHSTELIALHRGFFDALTDIEQVVVLGHPLSAVDAAYFKTLLEQSSVAEVQWQVACRFPEEWSEKPVLLAHLGIDPTKTTPVSWEAL